MSEIAKNMYAPATRGDVEAIDIELEILNVNVEDMGARLTRIETRLCTLMEHLGMKPVNNKEDSRG
jgi:hypothetical protein